MNRYVLLLALTIALVAPFPVFATTGCCNFCPDQYQQEGQYPYFEVIRTQRQLLDEDVTVGGGWKRIFESCAQVNRVNVTASQEATVVARAFLQLNNQTTPGVDVEYRWILDDVPVGTTFHFRVGLAGFPHGDDINIVLPHVAAGAHRMAIEARVLAESGTIKFRLMFVTAQGFPSQSFPGASLVSDQAVAIGSDWTSAGATLTVKPAEAARLYLQSYVSADAHRTIDFRYVIDGFPMLPFTVVIPAGGGLALWDHYPDILDPGPHTVHLEARAATAATMSMTQVEAATAPAAYTSYLLPWSDMEGVGSLGDAHQPLNCLILSAAGAGGTGGLGGTPACGKYQLLLDSHLDAAGASDDYTIFGDGYVEIENRSATSGIVTLTVEAIYEDASTAFCNTLIDTPNSTCASPQQCATADFTIAEFSVLPGRTQKFFYVDPVHWGSSKPNHIRLWARSQDGCGAAPIDLSFGRSRLGMQLVPAGLGSCFSARAQGRAAAPSLTVVASAGKAVLQWQSPESINGYWEILRATDTGSFTLIARNPNEMRTFTDTTVKGGVAYRYEIRPVAVSTDFAVGFSYICGALSNEIRVTVPPIAPRRRASGH
ncbi:MAG TPA: hypothetical protein VHX14_10275 [Thermoanaerobaculia bacterium]|jgi:hypothetical protein|nr:hypothetical protein [Thermoanaerobaculia bacterium]